MTDAAELLGDEVLGLGRAVRRASEMEVQDLGLPGTHGRGETGERENLRPGDVRGERFEPSSGDETVLGRVDLVQQLLVEDRGPDFAVGVAGAQRAAEPPARAESEALEAPGHEASRRGDRREVLEG